MPGFEIIGEEERAAVNEVFDRGGCLFRYGFDFMRNGCFKVVEFEKAFAGFLGLSHAQAVTSGTAALYAINRVLNFGPGDEIITQAYTFVATVEAITEVGATPIITEVDETLNMDPVDLERRITDRTKAIWVVHMMGGPARLREILAIGKKYNIPVLEDTAQGLGAYYDGKLCGTFGYASAFSFDFGKMMTCGDGGAALTNDPDFYLKLRAYCDHGHEDNPNFPRGEDTASRNGFNFRMMELQGAIALAQLRKLPEALKAVRRNRDKLKTALRECEGHFRWRTIPTGGEDAGDTLVMFFNSVDERRRVSTELAKRGVGFKLLPGAVKWHFAGRWDHIFNDLPAYKGKEIIKLWPQTLDLLERSIALPVMIKMDDDKIHSIATNIKEVVGG